MSFMPDYRYLLEVSTDGVTWESASYAVSERDLVERLQETSPEERDPWERIVDLERGVVPTTLHLGEVVGVPRILHRSEIFRS
jgi:hypothetical protein